MRIAVPVVALLLAGCTALNTVNRRPATGGRPPEQALSARQILMKEAACALRQGMPLDTSITRLDTLPTYRPDSTGNAPAVAADSAPKTKTNESTANQILDAKCRTGVVKAPIPATQRPPT